MPESIVVSIIAFLGTLAGTWGGIRKSNELTNYRIKQLEEKVHKHNELIERTYKIEEDCSVIHEQIKVANNRIKDLEEERKA